MFKDDFYWELKKFGIDDETIYYNDCDRLSPRKHEIYDEEDGGNTKKFKPRRALAYGDYSSWYFHKAS